MNTRMHLSALGWVSDAPAGNRLRVSYPLEAPDGAGGFLGLPEVLIIQRAPLEEDVEMVETKAGPGEPVPSAPLPYAWWDDVGTVTIAGGLPPRRYTFPTPVQAVRFTYQGPDGRVLVWDDVADPDEPVEDRSVQYGDVVYAESAAIEHLEFLAFETVHLVDLSTLDLFTDRNLDWEDVARIHVRDSESAGFAVVQPRFDGPTTLQSQEWTELAQLMAGAAASSPSSETPVDPTPWQEFQTVIALRWEHAVLCGLGFFDGPRSDVPALDEIDTERLLWELPPTPMVYRIVEEAGRVPASNAMLCPNTFALPLLHPGTPSIHDPAVRLGTDGSFEATYSIRWQGVDARAIGALVAEERLASPSVSSSPSAEELESRTRRSVDLPRTGVVARVVDVPFHDVMIRSRARTIDGWDRTSTWSGWSGWTGLALEHAPEPPPLLWARTDGSSTVVGRAVTAAMPDPPAPADDWTPDVIVLAAAGRVEICRQSTPPAIRSVTVTAPFVTSGGTYRATVAGISTSDLPIFSGGYLVAGRIKAKMTSLSGSTVFFEAPDEPAGAVTLFEAGAATLQQDPTDPSLWVPVTDIPAAGLPAELTIPDPISGSPDGTVVLTYAARITYLGRVGPLGNTVRALYRPTPPTIGPPFTVILLGLDFFNRSVLMIELSSSSSGSCAVWWAEGWSSEWPEGTAFNDQATPGEFGAQPPQYGRILYEVLALPVARKTDRRVTIGVQRVNGAGAGSEYRTVSVTLPATEPT